MHHHEVPLAASPMVAMLHALWDAWSEALAARRQYEHLRSRGVLHDTALRESLGLGRISGVATPHAAKPLYLAGKV
jgi:hypothetical protein